MPASHHATATTMSAVPAARRTAAKAAKTNCERQAHRGPGGGDPKLHSWRLRLIAEAGDPAEQPQLQTHDLHALRRATMECISSWASSDASSTTAPQNPASQ
jgi:hypothetical protein